MIRVAPPGTDLFAVDADALANPVNCVGVMGAGLAKEFKVRWPAMFEAYRRACAADQLAPGSVWAWSDERVSGPAVACVATKRHWRDPSQLKWVRFGARNLDRLACDSGMSTVAVPALGAGLGRLDPVAVSEVLVAELAVSRVEYVLVPPIDVVAASA